MKTLKNKNQKSPPKRKDQSNKDVNASLKKHKAAKKYTYELTISKSSDSRLDISSSIIEDTIKAKDSD